jgi:hypothetical protein
VPIPVYLEVGKKRVFAAAVEWPGWCRSASSPDGALAALDIARSRYRRAVPSAPRAGEFEVIETVIGGTTTDFGAPGEPYSGDSTDLDANEMTRQLRVLRRCWNYFDAVVSAAPESLVKGPRGGGRDTSAIVAHVQESERTYGARLGAKIPPRTEWPVQRDAIVTALSSRTVSRWPAPYGIRRIAWHVLDHAFEIEDRS